MEIHSFRDLDVWRKSMDLVKAVYLFTNTLPKTEMFGLTSQIRRAAVSVPSNIAEGKQRRTVNEYVYFLGIAYGSTAELETQLILVKDLFVVDKESYLKIISGLAEVQKMLNVLMSRLKPNT